MKFKFCGDNDCQDWLLAQINLLSKLTSIKIKVVLNEVIKHILTGQLDFDKVIRLTSDAKLNEDETKAVVAALNFIVTSSSRYDTESEVLSNELQQLGLPKEHSTSLCKVYSDNFDQLKEALQKQSMKFFGLKSGSYEIKSNFSTDTYVLDFPAVFLNLKNQETKIDNCQPPPFYIEIDKLDCLIRDLKDAHQAMENMNII